MFYDDDPDSRMEQDVQEEEELIATQENTQASSQPSQDPERNWNSHLWGFLVPCRERFPQEDFWRMHPTIRIGRSTGNDIVLSSLRVSNKHCEISWDGETVNPTVRVTDYSSNGTFINGTKVGKTMSMFLRDGNEIGFGTWGGAVNPDEDYRFIFRFAARGRPNDGINARYDFGHELGKGSFATVLSAMERTTGRIWAVKAIHRNRFQTKNKDTMNMFLREIRILESLKHPHICMLKEVFFDDTIHLVLEYVDGGDLLDYICRRNGLDETMTKHIVVQLLDALKYIHDKGIAHRDLKPENVLLTKANPPVVKVADFGLAKAVDSMTKFKTTCGTPCYLAPEVILREDPNDGYDMRVDSWSVGVIVFSMMSNSSPFTDDDSLDIQTRFRNRRIQWSLLPTKICSALGFDFIHRLLQNDPNERLTCAEALNHDWVNTPGGFGGLANMDPNDMLLPPDAKYDTASQSLIFMSDVLVDPPVFPPSQSEGTFGETVPSSQSFEDAGSDLATPVPESFPPVPSQQQAQQERRRGAPITRRVQDLERRDPEGLSQVLNLLTPEELAAEREQDRQRMNMGMFGGPVDVNASIPGLVMNRQQRQQQPAANPNAFRVGANAPTPGGAGANGANGRKRKEEEMVDDIDGPLTPLSDDGMEEPVQPVAGSSTRAGTRARNVKQRQGVPVIKAPAKPRRK